MNHQTDSICESCRKLVPESNLNRDGECSYCRAEDRAGEMSVGDLRSGIDESLKKNVSAAPLLTEQNLRIAAGFTPFVFVALGIALGVKLKKGSRSG